MPKKTKEFKKLEYADLVVQHLSIEQKKIILHQDEVIRISRNLVDQIEQFLQKHFIQFS